jgi:hypothetical protein
MKILTPSCTVILSSFLLFTNVSFAWRDANVSLKRSAELATNSAVALATGTFLADAAQQTESPAKADSTPQPPAQLPPDSYVATAVGVMFLAGIVLLLAKWPRRRRANRNVYRFPRNTNRTRRAS